MTNHTIDKALNFVIQIHPQFKNITAQLNKILNIQFGYMKVFKDGSYFKIMDDLECLRKFVTNVEKSHIFCERNVTNCFDGEYNFTLWPKEPNCAAMNIYNECSVWNGISVSKTTNDYYTEIYWFVGGTTRADWHKFYIRNKPLLLKFIKYFDSFKQSLHFMQHNTPQDLFKFNNGFDHSIPRSEYLKNESSSIDRLINSLNMSSHISKELQIKLKLSPREIEVLTIISHGYTSKLIAKKLNISVKTVQCYIDRVKHKTGLHYKTELVKLYENYYQDH